MDLNLKYRLKQREYTHAIFDSKRMRREIIHNKIVARCPATRRWAPWRINGIASITNVSYHILLVAAFLSALLRAHLALKRRRNEMHAKGILLLKKMKVPRTGIVCVHVNIRYHHRAIAYTQQFTEVSDVMTNMMIINNWDNIKNAIMGSYSAYLANFSQASTVPDAIRSLETSYNAQNVLTISPTPASACCFEQTNVFVTIPDQRKQGPNNVREAGPRNGSSS
ncbi:hypothetical protein V1506DRAFT_536951 [Lipomyces tetrasporus]